MGGDKEGIDCGNLRIVGVGIRGGDFSVRE